MALRLSGRTAALREVARDRTFAPVNIAEQLNTALAGRYEIDREIGAGGMATVYLARDLRHDRRVALKVLHPDLAAALGADRFLAEIRTTANLQHPHILPLHDSGAAGGHLFYVMPFVEGETLRARLDRETQLPIDDAVRIAREVLGALDYAHRHGVVHRDVKPENILLHDGSALVADFGIALAVSAAAESRMTQTGLSLGTPQYMSPEQAMGEKSIDGRSDIYALAAVLYEMLTGEPPFSGATVQAIVAKVITERPTPPTTVRDTIPPQVEAAVLRALAKLPADRFATAAQFADALVTPTLPTASHTAIGAPSARARTKWRTAAIANGLIAAALLVATILAVSRHDPPPPVERFEIPTIASVAVASARSSMTYTGSAISISPDGRRIVYAGRDSSGGSGIILRDLGQIEQRSIRGSDGATSVTLSADGNTVAFIADGVLKTLDCRGGSATTIAGKGAVAPYWGDDGWIYYASASMAGGIGSVFRVPAVGGDVDTLFSRAGVDISDPVPLPGGKALLVRLSGGRDRGIAVLDVKGRAMTRLVDGTLARYLPSGRIVYRTPAGELMVVPFDVRNLKLAGPATSLANSADNSIAAVADFAVSARGDVLYLGGGADSTGFVWVGRNGFVQQRLDSARHGVSFPALSPDGTRIAFTSGGVVYVMGLSDHSLIKLTLERQGGNYPAWTPDGKSVSYFGASGPGDGRRSLVLWLKRADGSGQPTLLASVDRDIAESAWSPDGKWVLFRTFSNQRGSGDILGLRPGIDKAPVPLIATTAVEVQPVISPDGRWLAYVSDQTGRYEVYVVPFPNTGGGVWSVSMAGGSEPRWSRKGDELFYRDARGNLVSVAVKPGPTFSLGASRVLFAAAKYVAYSGHQQYDVSPDGQRFLMSAGEKGSGSTTMVLVRNLFH